MPPTNKKENILAFLTVLDKSIGRYKAHHGEYPKLIPFLIYMLHMKPNTGIYRNRPTDTFTHLSLTTGATPKSIYPKVYMMDWSYIPSISLDNLIVHLIDPGAPYQSAPAVPGGIDYKEFYIPTFITEDYCQDKWYIIDW